MATKITIGGKEYTVEELNFIVVEKAWAQLRMVMVNPDPIFAVGAGISIIAFALIEQDDFDKANFGIAPEVVDVDAIDASVILYLKKKLKASEISSVQQGLVQLIKEAGLEAEEGEARQMLENLLTGTSTPSTQASSQPASREETGTGSESTGVSESTAL
jgi:hypothetical protein